MTGQIDFKYLIDYLRIVDKNRSIDAYRRPIALLQQAVNVLKDFSLMPGYCKDNDNRHLLNRYGFPVLPGIDNTTWCTYFVFRLMLVVFEEKALYLCDATKKIGYTTADEMVSSIIDCRTRGIFREISWLEAQKEANQGKVVIVAAEGLYNSETHIKNSSHVAIVCPTYQAGGSMFDMYVIQAGVINGIVKLSWAFALRGNIVAQPRFFKL